jgi:hypothetical protein
MRVLEEFLDLLELLHRLVNASDVAEGNFRRVDRHPLGFRFAEVHHPAAAALHLVHQEDPKAEEEDEGQDQRQQREQPGAAGAVDVSLDFVLLKLVKQALLGVGRVPGREAFAVGALDVERVVLGVDVDFFNLALGDQAGFRFDQLVVARGLGATAVANHFLGDERQDYDQQDRERRAFEETPQG